MTVRADTLNVGDMVICSHGRVPIDAIHVEEGALQARRLQSFPEPSRDLRRMVVQGRYSLGLKELMPVRRQSSASDSVSLGRIGSGIRMVASARFTSVSRTA